MMSKMYSTTCKGEGCGVPIKAHDERHEYCPKCWGRIQLKMCDRMEAYIKKREADTPKNLRINIGKGKVLFMVGCAKNLNNRVNLI